MRASENLMFTLIFPILYATHRVLQIQRQNPFIDIHLCNF